MKKLLLLFVLASIVVFSCKKSSNSNPSVTIVGKWHFTADTIVVDIPGLTDQSYYNTFGSGDYVQFNSNGSGTAVTTVAGGGGEISTEQFTYKLSDNVLTVNYPQETVDNETTAAYSVTGPVKVLTSNKLVLSKTQTYTDSTGTTKIEEIDYLAK